MPHCGECRRVEAFKSRQRGSTEQGLHDGPKVPGFSFGLIPGFEPSVAKLKCPVLRAVAGALSTTGEGQREAIDNEAIDGDVTVRDCTVREDGLVVLKLPIHTSLVNQPGPGWGVFVCVAATLLCWKTCSAPMAHNVQ